MTYAGISWAEQQQKPKYLLNWIVCFEAENLRMVVACMQYLWVAAVNAVRCVYESESLDDADDDDMIHMELMIKPHNHNIKYATSNVEHWQNSEMSRLKANYLALDR